MTTHAIRKRFDPKTMSVITELVEVPGAVVEVPEAEPEAEPEVPADAAAEPEAGTTDAPEAPEAEAAVDAAPEAPAAEPKPKPKRGRRKKAAKKNADA